MSPLRVKCPPSSATWLMFIFDMATEEEEYDAVFHFLRSGQYPAGFSKNEKRALRRKAKDNYKVEKDALFYRPRGGSTRI